MDVVFTHMDVTRDWVWIQNHLPLHWTDDTVGIIAVDKDGRRVAAAIFDSWTYNSVNVHQIIVQPWVLRHGWFQEIAKYVYITAGRRIMYGLVPSDNAKALKLNKNIGFEEICVLKDAVEDGVDMHVLELRKENCRFLVEEVEEEIDGRR